MSGHKPFKNLSDQLRSTPEGRTAVAWEKQIMDDVRTLMRLRETHGVTAEELARAWEISQTEISRDEHERDAYLSTLCSYIAALGGHLELRAVFPDQTIILSAPAPTSPERQQIA